MSFTLVKSLFAIVKGIKKTKKTIVFIQNYDNI
jgi:hypothetical protein